MTASIDKKIVEMAFENGQFEKGVGTSISTLDKLKKSLNFSGAGKSFDDITASANRVNLGGISDGLSRVTGGFSALAIAGITSLVRLTNAAIDAGIRIAKSLVIDPISLGFADYGSKLTSIQTITSATGKSIQEVAVFFNQLDDYADKTIFNLNDMTGALAKFTNAGVDLNVAVPAIKGIANMVALAGQDANAAGIAFYNLSQSIAGGFLTTTDFRSLNLANVATKEWKNNMIAGAVAAGTLRKTTDGMFEIVGTTKIVKDTQLFTEELSTGWATAKVLTDVLGQYGDTTTEIGKKAQAAAQDVKSFSMMMETLKASVGTGWTDTFEILVGNLTEAKALFGPLTSFFQEIFDQVTDARNNLLQGWKDLGGRTAVIAALQNALNGIVSIVQPLKDGFKDIFPPITAQQLYNISLNLRLLTEKMILSGETADKLKRVFKGVFAIFDIGKMFVMAIVKEFGRLLKAISPVGGSLFDLLANFGDWIVALRDGIKANQTFEKVMKTIGDTILLVAGLIGKGLSSFTEAIKKFKELHNTEGFFKAFLASIQAFFGSFKNLDFGILKDFVDKIKERFAPLAKIGDFLKKAFSKTGGGEANPFIQKILTIASNVRAAIGKFVLGVLDSISKIDFSNLNFNKVFDGINGGLLGALLLSITRFVNKGSGLFGGILDIFKGISGFAENANGILASITTVMTGVKDILTAWQQQVRAGILMKIAGAIAILAVSLIGLSLVDSEKLTGALAAVSVLFADLFASIATYEKVSGGTAGIPAMAKAIGVMLGLSSAILLLSVALVALAQIPTEDIIKGVLSITALSAVLIGVSVALSKSGATMIKGSASMAIFSLALLALIVPLKKLAKMDPESLSRGLVGLGILLAEIGVFMKAMNFNVSDLDDVFGLLILSGAIQVLSSVIDQLGKLDASVITQGLTVLGILMAAMATFSRGATGGGAFILTAAGMVVLAGAMEIMADVLAKIGALSWEELAVGLTGLAGSLLIFAVALNAMTGGIAGAAALLVAAGALALMVPPLKALGSMDLAQVGIALVAMAGAFTILGLAASILTPLLPSLLLLGVSMGIIGIGALGVGVAILAVSTALAALAVTGAAGGAAIAGLLLAIAAVLPTMATAVALGIIEFARTIKKGAPIIFAAARSLIIGFLDSIGQSIPAMVDVVLTFIVTMLQTIGEKMPEFIQAGYDIIIGFLSGVSDNIATVIPLAGEVVEKFLKGIADQLPMIAESGWNLIISWVDALTATVEENIPRLLHSTRLLGIAIVKGIITGLAESREDAITGIKEIGKAILEGFKSFLGIHSPSTVFAGLALDIINGLILGVKNNIVLVRNSAVEMGQRIVNGIREKIGDMSTAGRDIVLGLAQGIRDFVGNAVQAAVGVASAVVTAVRNTVQARSPARKLIDVGEDIDDGLALGITKFAGRVTDATTGLGNKAVSGFKGVVSKISDSLNTNMDFVPTIRPVVDLTEIQNSGSLIDSIFGDKTLNVGAVAVKAANSAPVDPSTVVETPDAEKVAPSVTFTQINNSPKELSRIDLYRQTKNLLLTKGLATND